MWGEFRRRKLEELKEAGADEKILPLLKKINAKADYITSSSCSGRIALLEIREGKKDARLYRTWHEEVEPKEIMDAIKNYDGKKMLWLRCEPFILHLFPKDLRAAGEFLEKCKIAGIKRGGIQQIKPRIFIEIQGSAGFALPVKDGRTLISDSYLRYVIRIANSTLEKNFARLRKLSKLL